MNGFLFCVVLLGFATLVDASVFNGIDSRLKDDLYRDVDVAVVVTDLDKQESLYLLQPHLELIPASLTKLLLTGACLDYLSRSYRFKTKIYVDKMDLPTLYIKGEGDPNQTLEQFDLLANALKKKKIDRLKTVVLDTSMVQMDPNLYANSARYYYALGGALNFNYNQIQLLVDDSKKQLSVRPLSDFVELDVRSLRFLSSDKRGFPRISLHQRPGFDKYIIRGTVSKQDELYTNLQLRVSRPSHFYASMLKQVLKTHGIVILEPLRFERFKLRKKKRLVTLTSLPLDYYLQQMNQESSNMIANIILKILGGLEYGEPGTQRKGLRLLDHFMNKKLLIHDETFRFKDGSGLSHYNRLSADHMTRFLRYFYKQYPELLESMFVDVKQSDDYDELELPDHYQVYVKSGTLSHIGVNNLAGYVRDSRLGKLYSFVIMTKYKDSKKPAYKGTLSNPLLQQLIHAIQFH
ncbi:D-alanyl-D-alanine carboxypeptidase/D-alanyl-D-alanine-endopeptidase [bacterium]|nr:D-alanyl-D-alanine carboxypeptidase/D-alanyl-D-alanine-endopeptidase [bacterium]